MQSRHLAEVQTARVSRQRASSATAQLARVADQVKKILGTRSARKEFSILLNRGHVQAWVTVLPVIRTLEAVSLLVSLVWQTNYKGRS